MSHRLEQVNELLRKELAFLINREVELPDVLITVIRVKCSSDLRNAKIFISVLPETYFAQAKKKLKHANKTIAAILRKKLNLKYIPWLNWELDQNEKHAIEIEKIINQINQ